MLGNCQHCAAINRSHSLRTSYIVCVHMTATELAALQLVRKISLYNYYLEDRLDNSMARRVLD